MVYARMLRQLDGSRPVFGFLHQPDEVPHAFDDPHWLAARLAEIQQVQPAGPYYLAGECMGGLTAYAVACSLQNRGEKVGFLALLDTRPPQLRTSTAAFLRGVSDLIRDGWRRTREMPWQQRYTYLYDRMRYVLKLRRTHFRSVRGRHLPAFTGKVCLLVNAHDASCWKLTAAWAPFVRGGIEEYVVGGNHESYIRDHAAATGAALHACLEAATRGATDEPLAQ